MTWPALIAAACGLIAVALVVLSQHGLGARNTPPKDPPDGAPT